MHKNSEQFFDDNFFVIASDNLQNIKPRIYGYVFLENKILINAQCNEKFPYDACGCFVNITKGDCIEIYQDYFRSYGLYLYNKGEYFAISNSFLMLVRFLERKKLTVNIDFAKCFLTPPTATLAYTDTMIEEISMLPANCFVRIEKSKINIIYFEQKETFIPVDSKEGIDIIDAWHDKWNRLISNLIGINEYISCDLSGGKDSRASFSILFNKNIDFNLVNINSTHDDLYTHDEDFKIASAISEKYTFFLNNNNYKYQRYRTNPLHGLTSSLITKCGFHKELMFSTFYNGKRVFRITGMCGDLRDFWGEPINKFIERNINNIAFNSIDCASSLKKMLEKTVREVSPILNPGQHTAKDIFYRKVRVCHQYGKATVELFLSNIIAISPLLDPILYKLTQDINKENDYDLIYAILYSRFMPEINDIPFDSNRIIKKETLQIASEINSKFPYRKRENSSGNVCIIDNRVGLAPSSDTSGNAVDLLMDFFYSQELRDFIVRYFGEEIYEDAINYHKTHKYHGYIQAAGLVEIYIIHKELSKKDKYDFIQLKKKSILSHAEYANNGFIKEILDILQSGRIDIRNIGADEYDISLINVSDIKAYIEYPYFWQGKNGKGVIIQSITGSLTVDFCVIGEGICSINLLGPYFKNKKGILCPINIDYNYVELSDLDTKSILVPDKNAMYTVNSMNSKKFELKVHDSQKLRLKISWLPFIYSKDMLFELLKNLYDSSIGNFRFWKGIKKIQ